MNDTANKNPPQTPIALADSGDAITANVLERFKSGFEADPVNQTLLNAVTRTTIDEVALNRRVVAQTDHTFSHVLDDWTATNQKASGRCWLFAGLNLLRTGVMQKMKLKDFEFSQNYILFWHKLERSNYFLEAILDTAERDIDDRTVAYLLDHPNDDGGQWTMFAGIIKKYGLLPKAFMPETQSSSNTRRMNYVLTWKLRDGALKLRDLSSQGVGQSALRQLKQKILDEIYRILCIHLGQAPARFTWQWQDTDRRFHRDPELTPLEFAAKYLSADPDDYVCLVNDPRSASQFGRTYTVNYLGNIVGANPVLYLNVEIDVMKAMAMETILAGEPVWFGCDMAQMTSRKLGLMDSSLYDLVGVYRINFELDKGERLYLHQSHMNHAMLFTGVDVVAGKSRRWRVENSWGEEPGKKGFFTMSDNWFDEFVFEIAVNKSLLSRELRDSIEVKPKVLPPWDPMGSLA